MSTMGEAAKPGIEPRRELTEGGRRPDRFKDAARFNEIAVLVAGRSTVTGAPGRSA